MQPESASKELVGTVENWRASGIRNDLQLQRIKQQADALKTTQDRAYAFMILGMVACLRDEPEEMRRNHDTSLRLDPGNSLLINNYSTSLLASGFVQEAIDKQRETLDSSEPSSEAVNEYIGALASGARLKEAIELMQRNNSEYVGPSDLTVEDLKRWRGVFEERGISDADCQQAIEAVYAVMHDNGYFFHISEFERTSDESTNWLSFVVHPANANSVDQIMDLNFQLVESLASKEISAFDTGALIARFSCPRGRDGK